MECMRAIHVQHHTWIRGIKTLPVPIVLYAVRVGTGTTASESDIGSCLCLECLRVLYDACVLYVRTCAALHSDPRYGMLPVSTVLLLCMWACPASHLISIYGTVRFRMDIFFVCFK